MQPDEVVDLPACGDMHFRARRDEVQRPNMRWTVWCARTPALDLCAVDVDFALDCWFEYGATLNEALGKLKREVLN